MTISIIDSTNLRDISSDLLMENGKLKLLPYKEYNQFSRDEIRVFCHIYGRYGIPTHELIDYINEVIDGRSAIEIGAGHGDLGYHLKIPMTDSKLQEDAEIKAFYALAGQKTISYPKDIQKFEAIDAVKYYKPKVVIGSWITRWVNPNKNYTIKCNGSVFGVKEDKLLKEIETYIMIGNLDIHGDKPICNRPHLQIYKPWLVSKALNQENNRIFIWDKSK